MPEQDALGRGRDAFANRAWADAHKYLSSADTESPLSPDDLERLAVTGRMLGKDAESADFWARAHQQALQDGDVARAVRFAFWLGFGLMDRGEFARGSGWLTRGQRMLEDAGLDCVERGYLVLPMAIGTMEEDPAASFELFAGVAEIASRFGDQSLGTMARVGRGRTLIRLGRPGEGLPTLDDAMIAVTSGEVHPMVVGDLYCSVVEACWEVFDVARAQEWTKALSAWCDSQPDLVPFRGQCRVHRSQILQLHGSWQEAMAEAEDACALFAEAPGPAIGLALYQRGELNRLLGEFKKAEDDYRATDEIGSSPHPGLAQLRLLQGRLDPAAAAMKRCLAESNDRVFRTRVLPGAVEILLAAGDAHGARVAADEFRNIAATFEAPFMRATDERAQGAVLLAEQNMDAALAALRESRAHWQALDAPFEVACTRMLVGAACRSLGDDDGAQIELEAARRTFEQLGAAPFIANVHQLAGSDPRANAGGLTGRELEVLRLVAGGASNRAIAEKLVLSEKTVARHVSNIFMKLGLSSRSAATAYAYEHHLV